MSNQIKCEGCAFNSGTRANRSQMTQISARLCVETKTPFYCHDTPERISKEGFNQEEAMLIAEQNRELRLCAGYVDAVKMLAETGFYERQPEWKTKAGEALLGLISAAYDNPKLTVEEANIYFLSELERLKGEYA